MSALSERPDPCELMGIVSLTNGWPVLDRKLFPGPVNTPFAAERWAQ